MRLCEAAFGELETYDGERFHSAAIRGLPSPYAEFRTSRTHVYGPGTVPARFLAGEHLIHVADAKAEKAIWMASAIAVRWSILAVLGRSWPFRF